MAKRINLGTRKGTYVNKRRQGVRARLIPWIRRFGVNLAMFTALIWLGAWFFLSEADTRTADWFNNQAVNASASLGFKVRNILIEGRRNTDPGILKAVINIQKGDPLFSLDPAAAKKTIEQIVWMDNVRVERRLPDTVYIKLEERTPLALWQKDKKLQLIDHKGDIIPVKNLSPFKNLVIVMGDEAPQNTFELFQVLVGEPEIYKRVESAGFISQRRWDIILKNDLRIKLPETGAAYALSRLAKAQHEDKILDKDLTGIDLRDPERMIVRAQPGNSQEYRAGYSRASTRSSNDI